MDPDLDLATQFMARATTAACAAAIHVHIKTHCNLQEQFEKVFTMLEGRLVAVDEAVDHR